MTRKTEADPAVDPAASPYLALTPNQVVAYNLALARDLKGWTQDQAAEALEPYLGKRWSKASVSQAERSIAGRFIRNFDADEIVAFARAYELPITWFFMPPPPRSDEPGQPVKLDTPDIDDHGAVLAELIDLVFGDDHQQALLTMRLETWLAERPAQLTAAQQRIINLARARVDILARHALNELSAWQTTLRAMANHLQDLEARAERATAEDLGRE